MEIFYAMRFTVYFSRLKQRKKRAKHYTNRLEFGLFSPS